MAADDDMKAMQEVIQLRKTEPSSPSLSQPDIPALPRRACNSGFYRQIKGSHRRAAYTRGCKEIDT